MTTNDAVPDPIAAAQPRKLRAGARETRDQQTRDSKPIHDVPIDFTIQGPLPDIPARPGYAQRWVRILKDGRPDSQNLFAVTRRGWAPRSPNTLPKEQQFLTVTREGLGGCIGTHDMVLMERHEGLNRQEQDIKRQDRRDREKAVKENLFSEYRNLGGASTGFSAPSVENSAHIERGRQPTIQDD